MVRILARIIAKWKYVFTQEIQAATNELHAGLSARLAIEKHALVDQLNKDADGIEKRIAEMVAMEEKGFWTCEDGHELPGETVTAAEGRLPSCNQCGKPLTLIKRYLMSGQEQYESDKERKEAEKIVADKRQQANAEQEI